VRFRRLIAIGALVAAVQGVSPAAAGAAVPHTVVPGETLWSIAAANNFTTRSLAAYNGLPESAQVVVGTTIQIPGEGEAAAALGGAAPAAAPTPAQPAAGPSTPPAVSPGGGEPQTTNERTSAGEIGSIAAAHGESPSLAAGIAWQESGFDNSLTSTANARGVMQILPGTWDFIQSNLAGYALSPASARENVHAGVMYLNWLRRQTGDETTAVASYYQGLGSVRADGLFPETQRYVQSVMAHRSRFGSP
jgi:N-acetylmuramoyl-L-alanine amidase